MNKSNTHKISDYSGLSDLELVLLYKNKNKVEAFGELYKRYTHLMLGLCLNYLKDQDEAYDTVMDVFEKLMVDLKKHNIVNFKSWLYSYTKNYCLMLLRHRKVEDKYVDFLKKNSDDFVDFGLQEHHDDIDLKEKIRTMLRALERLKDEQKQCLSLFYLENKNYEEVALLTGYTDKKVKSYIQNGKRNLKIMMVNIND